MAMTKRVSVKLDSTSEAAMNRIMQHTGWTKSRVLREAIKAAAENDGVVPGTSRRANRKVKVES
jgi:predicted DNA-binding protein